jgi:cell wall-associated NlpC family hydrolase
MSLDGISAIQSRISEIQQNFSPAPTSSQQSTAATAAQNLQFADLLDAASSLGSDATSSDGTANALTGTGTDQTSLTSSLANALGLGNSTGSNSSLTDALTSALGGATSGSTTNGLSTLESLLGQNTGSSVGALDPSSLATLEQLLNAANGTVTNTTTATVATGVNSAANQKFVQSALAMAGDPYVYGATGSPLDPHPNSFDCSGLTQWAAGRAGVTLPRTAQQQYLALKNQGDLIPVQQAINTPGALLFSFSSEPSPTNMYPSHAHVAISLGNGKTIEARGHAYGVGIFDAANRFNYAGVVPGLTA